MPTIAVLKKIKEKFIGVGAAAFTAAILLAPGQAFAEEATRLDNSSASIPVSQIFELEYANAVDLGNTDPDYQTFTYILSTEDADAPLPGGSVNGEYAFTMDGNETVQLPIAMMTGEEKDLIFKHAGVYTYELKQDQEGKDQPPYTLDATSYTIRIYVVNENNGIRLEAVTAENVQSETKVKGIEFSNLYTGTPGLMLTAEKRFGEDPFGLSKEVESVQVNLQRSIKPDDPNSWEDVVANIIDLSMGKTSVVFDELLKYDKTGNEYHYRAYESAITLTDGKTIKLKAGAIGGFISTDKTTQDKDGNYKTVITNTPITGEISVTKVWKDNDNKSKARPETISFRLAKDGVDLGDSYVRTLFDQTKIKGKNVATWKDLPVMNADGSVIQYTITEPAYKGYTATVTDGAKSFIRNKDGSISVIVSGTSHKGLFQNTADKLSGKTGQENATLDAKVEFTNTLDGGSDDPGSNPGGGGGNGGGGNGGGGGNVKTGDNTPIALYVALVGVSLLIIIALIVLMMRRRKL